MVPAGVPDDVVARLEAAIATAVTRESFIAGMENIYIPVIHYGTSDGSEYVRGLQENLRELLPKLGS